MSQEEEQEEQEEQEEEPSPNFNLQKGTTGVRFGEGKSLGV